MQITSNNVANVNTEGYSRKTASILTRTLDGQATGVRLSDIQRTVDDRLLRQLQDHIARPSPGRPTDLETFGKQLCHC